MEWSVYLYHCGPRIPWGVQTVKSRWPLCASHAGERATVASDNPALWLLARPRFGSLNERLDRQAESFRQLPGVSLADFALAVEDLADDGARAEDFEQVYGAESVLVHEEL